MLQELKLQLASAQNYMKQRAYTGRREVVYEVGDLVYLRLQPYRMKSLAKKLCEKLSPRYFGPFPILQKIGQVAYKLQLPLSASIHPVFHVSQLKKAVGDSTKVQPLPELLSEDMEWLVEPEDIKAIREGSSGMEVLVLWKNLPDFEATWESVTDLQLQFPNLHLEDKVSRKEGSNDKTLKVYKRKKFSGPRKMSVTSPEENNN